MRKTCRARVYHAAVAGLILWQSCLLLPGHKREGYGLPPAKDKPPAGRVGSSRATT
jgi:hypothetical protein